MNIEIVEAPVRFKLHGIGGVVEGGRYGEVGVRLMNEMWGAVKGAGAPNAGVNHWVYLPDGRLFVAIELRTAQAPPPLEPLEFVLPRHLRHIHVGPYDQLPGAWKQLKAELAARGEAIGPHSLEVYGHHSPDPSKQETTILIGLRPKAA